MSGPTCSRICGATPSHSPPCWARRFNPAARTDGDYRMPLSSRRSRPAAWIGTWLLRLGMGAGCALLMAAAKDADTPSVLVQTVRVRQGSAPRIVQAFGTVQVDSSARDTVVSPLSAIVGAIYVRSGEQVAAGTALLLL